jgi:outer membrane receptor protein involved in Fe transport
MEAAGKGLAIRSYKIGVPFAAALVFATPAAADGKPIEVPPGTVGTAAFAIGRQAGVSIVFADPALLGRQAEAIRGQPDASHALLQLAKASGLRLQKLGPNSYRLAGLPRQAPRAAPRHSTAPSSAALKAPKVRDPAPEDIVIVASKRDILSRRLAAAWSRIAGEEFAGLGIGGAEALEARAVGFSSTHLGSGRNKLFIRGIADSSFSGPTQSPVGLYFDDVRTGYSGADPDLKLVDMQSVEILEGPQGTLYGSGALGGIVLLRPNKPDFGESSGSLSSGMSFTRRGAPGHDTSGVLNLPLGSRAAFRAVAYRALDGGYINNIATGEKDVNDVRVTGARASLSLNPAGDWMIDAGLAIQRIRGNDSQYADRGGSGLSRDSLVDQPFASAFGLASVVVRSDSGALRFRSTSALTRQDIEENFDVSSGGDARQLRQHSNGRSLSNETRLWRPMADGYSWLAGFSAISDLYAVARDLRHDGRRIDLAGAQNRIREATLFGEAGLELGHSIDATVGGRYTIASLARSGQHLSPNGVIPPEADRQEHSFLPSASLLARPLDKLTVYARYQQGFRPGGVSIAAETIRLYRSDRLRTAEAGFRFGLPGRDSLDFEGSAAFSKWSNIQADFLDPAGLPATDNIGDGRVWTLSANGGTLITDGIRLEAGLAWNDGRITRPAPRYRIGWDPLNGMMGIPNIARVVARAALDWRTPVGDDRSIRANLYVRYVGRSRLGVGPQLGASQGQYVDSGLVLRLDDKRRAWTLNVTNITNAVGNRFAFGAPMRADADQITPLRPRTVRIGIEQKF